MNVSSFDRTTRSYDAQEQTNSQNALHTCPPPSYDDSLAWPPEQCCVSSSLSHEIRFDVPSTKTLKVKTKKNLKQTKKRLDKQFDEQKRSKTKNKHHFEKILDPSMAKKTEVVGEVFNVLNYQGGPKNLLSDLVNFNIATPIKGYEKVAMETPNTVDQSMSIKSPISSFSDQNRKKLNQFEEAPNVRSLDQRGGMSMQQLEHQSSKFGSFGQHENALKPNPDILNKQSKFQNEDSGIVKQNNGVLEQNFGPVDRSMSKTNRVFFNQTYCPPCSKDNVLTNPPYNGRCVCICKFPFSSDKCFNENCDPNSTSSFKSLNANIKTNDGKYIGILEKLGSSVTNYSEKLSFNKRPMAMSPNIKANKKELKKLSSDEKISFDEYMKNKVIEDRERMKRLYGKKVRSSSKDKPVVQNPNKKNRKSKTNLFPLVNKGSTPKIKNKKKNVQKALRKILKNSKRIAMQSELMQRTSRKMKKSFQKILSLKKTAKKQNLPGALHRTKSRKTNFSSSSSFASFSTLSHTPANNDLGKPNARHKKSVQSKKEKKNDGDDEQIKEEEKKKQKEKKQQKQQKKNKKKKKKSNKKKIQNRPTALMMKLQKQVVKKEITLKKSSR